ncbi:thiazolylpeptide-type bacteriocin [Kitasatospora sp. NPDC004669]|uniref:thiazolylpeptide-type bacteriocin n=1 Tax=Kitasatospora sp. NPDC004669 TaxID=3154555 RepID=UPI0033A51E9E
METAIAITDEEFSVFGVEELSVLDLNDSVALPELGASHSNFACCSSSSSSSCCC